MKKDNNLLSKKYIFWSVKPEKLNISDPWTRKWYLKFLPMASWKV